MIARPHVSDRVLAQWTATNTTTPMMDHDDGPCGEPTPRAWAAHAYEPRVPVGLQAQPVGLCTAVSYICESPPSWTSLPWALLLWVKF